MNSFAERTGAATTDCPPFLRWAGSKRRLIPLLKPFWTGKHKRYVEPFAGSACLFFALNPSRAILGDLNPELIATYRAVKYRLGEVLAELRRLLPADRTEYLRLRSKNTLGLSRTSRAARFIYLNRFCFNGIYRTNSAGQFNVPYSGDRCGDLPPDDLFRRCGRRLRCARFVVGDFEKVLSEVEEGDFVYMDPPYAIRARRVFREYDPATFSPGDIARLRHCMERIHAVGASFVVSYGESEEADQLRKGFSSSVVSVRRNVAGFAAHRAWTNEILITNS